MSDPYRPAAPSGRRVYAHVTAVTLACPRCGALSTRVRGGKPDGKRYGYDPRTAMFRCATHGCGYRAYVGVVLWPRVRQSTTTCLPANHVLTPAEAHAERVAERVEAEGVRAELSYFEHLPRAQGERYGGHDANEHSARQRRTNLECTCGEECAIHGPLAVAMRGWTQGTGDRGSE